MHLPYHTLAGIKWHLPLIRPVEKSAKILLNSFSVAVDFPKQFGVICKVQNRVDENSIQVVDKYQEKNPGRTLVAPRWKPFSKQIYSH